ncbi:MAG: DNA recombination protein RmuC [Parvularculaceae bacterium]
MNARLDAQGREIADALNALAHRLDTIGPATEMKALRDEIAQLRQSVHTPSFGPSAPGLQLENVVRDALSPGGYEFNAALTNNYRADCLIKLTRPPGPIAIDARFPVEAFSALHLARDSSAENEFRRIALRHIVSVAERLIAPGFTADSAMLFLPSESMAAELYARFPDIVQDSYRARVWIVSPTSLMATLHALGGVLRGAPVREHSTAALDDARRALAEIDRLETRLSALEIDGERNREFRGDPASERDASPVRLASTNEPQRTEQRSGIHNTLERDDLAPNGDLYGDNTDDGAPRQSARQPFPLR